MDKIKQFFSGSGDGDGDGYGDGDGSGSGDGDGYGDGDGSGSGDGYGDGYGDGDGSGSGYGCILTSYFGKPVHYIDGIPCIIYSIVKSIAKVSVIAKDNFSLSNQFIAKFNGVFAHGNTIEDAKRDAERKYYAELDTDAAIEKFIEQFPDKKAYLNADFYNWHTILTGSCDSGKDIWMKERGVNISGSMTVAQFLNLTKSSYGSEIIERIINLQS